TPAGDIIGSATATASASHSGTRASSSAGSVRTCQSSMRLFGGRTNLRHRVSSLRMRDDPAPPLDLPHDRVSAGAVDLIQPRARTGPDPAQVHDGDAFEAE